MKKFLLVLSLFIFGQLNAQLNPGDMAFIGFNADGDDDFAMVTFVDIPANTTVYFTDSEWNGSAFGTDENDFSWNSGAATIAAGTVITFYTISETPSVSAGTISGEPGGISAGSEAIFAFSGTAPRTPTRFIAAVANAGSAFGDLSGTELTVGTTAITYPDGTDIAQYKGTRTGLDINGFLVELNNMSNYDLQDNGDDNSADGIAPDVPFNTISFSISSIDSTSPSVANISVINTNTLELVFSENVTKSSVEDLLNYTINNAASILSITYNDATKTATLNHSGFITGKAYVLTVSNIEDIAGNTQESTFTSHALYFNNTPSGLIITEIMYNAPSDNSDALEFLEVYNNSNTTIELGGLQIKDEGNFIFTFSEQSLAANGIILLATDKTTADTFYRQTFIDMPQGISNALGNGGELLKILNTEGSSIFEFEYDDKSPWPTDADGNGPSIELLNLDADFNDGTNWIATTNFIGQSEQNNVYATPGVYSPATNVMPQITFAAAHYSIAENSNSVNVVLETSVVSANTISVDVNLVTELLTATQNTDFTFENLTFSIPANSTSAEINIPIINDNEAESDELFILQLSNPVNAALGNNDMTAVYILDNDNTDKIASNNLGITYETSYLVDSNGSAEISVHSPSCKSLFVINSIAQKLEILNFSDIDNISSKKTVDLSTYGDPTSVAYKNGLIAVAISKGPLENGLVLFMDHNGNNISAVTVGNLPDMVAYTPDGTKLLSANEGQPNNDYSVDPEGSISVIDVTPGLGNINQNHVSLLSFNAFDNQIENLKAVNVRITGPNATVSQDVEPEYITFANDSKTAWVTLQENNAVAVIDLLTNSITNIIPLGLKDHSLVGNTIDASDKTDFIFHANWPVKGMYMPDAIASYEVNGITYLVTANEGDAREYDTYEEEVKLSDVTLDPTKFPNQDLLALESNLGRLTFTNATGDTDGDGDLDEIHAFGSRSFSIWNATTGALVYDSGDDFERITAADPIYSELFNASNSNNNFKNRSDNKGPEPEGVTVAEINDRFYAFITLERVGGFMTYDVTDPNNPIFIKYINNRTTGDDEGGDLGPEGIIYIHPEKSPNGKGLIVLSNEVSSTISIYSINNILLNTDSIEANHTFKIYPNPAKSNQTIYFNQPSNVSLFDLQGRNILSKQNATQLNLPNLSTGTYVLKTGENESSKLIIK